MTKRFIKKSSSALMAVEARQRVTDADQASSGPHPTGEASEASPRASNRAHSPSKVRSSRKRDTRNAAWVWVPARLRRYSPIRKDAEGNPIIPAITDAVEAEVDRRQVSGDYKAEWVPPTFGPCR